MHVLVFKAKDAFIFIIKNYDIKKSKYLNKVIAYCVSISQAQYAQIPDPKKIDFLVKTLRLSAAQEVS